MWYPAIPHNQVTRVCTDLDPLEIMVLEPLHAAISETVPLWCPSWDPGFIGHLFVELLREDVTSSANDQAAIIRATRVEIDKTLEAAKACLCGILVLMRPWLAEMPVSSIDDQRRERTPTSQADLLDLQNQH